MLLYLANSLLLFYIGENRYPKIIMRSTLTTIFTSNYEVLQHATIAGYDLAYNKLRKMRKTTISTDGTKTSREFTVLTLVHKSRNGARAYLNHFTDGEWFTTMCQITGTYTAQAKGMKNSYSLIKQYLSNPANA